MSKDKLRPLLKAVADLPPNDTGMVLDIVIELTNNQHKIFREELRAHVARCRGARNAVEVSRPYLYKVRQGEELRTFNFGIGLFPETASSSEDIFFGRDVQIDTLSPEHNWYGKSVAFQVAFPRREICGKQELVEVIAQHQCFDPFKARALFASLMKDHLEGKEIFLDRTKPNYFLLDVDPVSPLRIMWVDGKWDFREVGDLIPKIEKDSKLFLAV